MAAQDLDLAGLPEIGEVPAHLVPRAPTSFVTVGLAQAPSAGASLEPLFMATSRYDSSAMSLSTLLGRMDSSAGPLGALPHTDPVGGGHSARISHAAMRMSGLIPASELNDPLNTDDMLGGEWGGAANLLANLPLVPASEVLDPVSDYMHDAPGSCPGVDGSHKLLPPVDGSARVSGPGLATSWLGGRSASQQYHKASSAPPRCAEGAPSPAHFLEALRRKGMADGRSLRVDSLSGPDSVGGGAYGHIQGERASFGTSMLLGSTGDAAAAAASQKFAGAAAAVAAAAAGLQTGRVSSPRAQAMAALFGAPADCGPVHVDTSDAVALAGVHSSVLSALRNRAGSNGASCAVSDPGSGAGAGVSGDGGSGSGFDDDDDDEDDSERDDDEEEAEDERQEEREQAVLRASELAEMRMARNYDELADDDEVQQQEDAAFDVAKYRGDESRAIEVPVDLPLTKRTVKLGDEMEASWTANPEVPFMVKPVGDPVRAGVRAAQAVQHAVGRKVGRSILKSQAAHNIINAARSSSSHVDGSIQMLWSAVVQQTGGDVKQAMEAMGRMMMSTTTTSKEKADCQLIMQTVMANAPGEANGGGAITSGADFSGGSRSVSGSGAPPTGSTGAYTTLLHASQPFKGEWKDHMLQHVEGNMARASRPEHTMPAPLYTLQDSRSLQHQGPTSGSLPVSGDMGPGSVMTTSNPQLSAFAYPTVQLNPAGGDGAPPSPTAPTLSQVHGGGGSGQFGKGLWPGAARAAGASASPVRSAHGRGPRGSELMSFDAGDHEAGQAPDGGFRNVLMMSHMSLEEVDAMGNDAPNQGLLNALIGVDSMMDALNSDDMADFLCDSSGHVSAGGAARSMASPLRVGPDLDVSSAMQLGPPMAPYGPAEALPALPRLSGATQGAGPVALPSAGAAAGGVTAHISRGAGTHGVTAGAHAQVPSVHPKYRAGKARGPAAGHMDDAPSHTTAGAAVAGSSHLLRGTSPGSSGETSGANDAAGRGGATAQQRFNSGAAGTGMGAGCSSRDGSGNNATIGGLGGVPAEVLDELAHLPINHPLRVAAASVPYLGSKRQRGPSTNNFDTTDPTKRMVGGSDPGLTQLYGPAGPTAMTSTQPDTGGQMHPAAARTSSLGWGDWPVPLPFSSRSSQEMSLPPGLEADGLDGLLGGDDVRDGEFGLQHLPLAPVPEHTEWQNGAALHVSSNLGDAYHHMPPAVRLSGSELDQDMMQHLLDLLPGQSLDLDMHPAIVARRYSGIVPDQHRLSNGGNVQLAAGVGMAHGAGTSGMRAHGPSPHVRHPFGQDRAAGGSGSLLDGDDLGGNLLDAGPVHGPTMGLAGLSPFSRTAPYGPGGMGMPADIANAPCFNSLPHLAIPTFHALQQASPRSQDSGCVSPLAAEMHRMLLHSNQHSRQGSGQHGSPRLSQAMSDAAAHAAHPVSGGAVAAPGVPPGSQGTNMPSLSVKSTVRTSSACEDTGAQPVTPQSQRKGAGGSRLGRGAGAQGGTGVAEALGAHGGPAPDVSSLGGGVAAGGLPLGPGRTGKAKGRAQEEAMLSGGLSDGDEDGEGEEGELEHIIRPHNGGEQRRINKQWLQEVYHLPINEAASSLGIGVTVLKKYCRKFKIGRWPFRKLKSMDKLIRSVQDQAAVDASYASDAALVISQLEQFKQMIYADPEVALDDRIKKLRQANFKLEYKQRQQTTVPGLGGVGGASRGEGRLSGQDDDDEGLDEITPGAFMGLLTGQEGELGMMGGTSGAGRDMGGDLVFSGDALMVGMSPRATRRGQRTMTR